MMMTTIPITRTIMAIIMDSAALYRLMTWMSPSYPVGAFSYSHGLEWEVETGLVHDAESLTAWLGDIVELGGGYNDAVLLSNAYLAANRQDDTAMMHVADHALALSSSAERLLETAHQGRAFCDVTCRTWQSPTLDRLMSFYVSPLAYPVAVGIAAVDHAIALPPLLEAYCHAFTANLISAGVRLVPLGHSDGQRVTMALEPYVAKTASRAISASLDDLISTTILADMASMLHETQYTRLFRS